MNNTVKTDKNQVTALRSILDNTIDRYDELTDTTDSLDILIKLVREKSVQLDEAAGTGELEKADELVKALAYLTARLDLERESLLRHCEFMAQAFKG